MTELPVPLSEEDKIRMLMIYVITQDGIKSEERRQLMQLAGTSRYVTALQLAGM